MIEILVLFVVGIGVGTFGTSLFGVFLNALSGTYAYVKQHRVYFKAAIPFDTATNTKDARDKTYKHT